MNRFAAFQFGPRSSSNTASTGQNIDWAQLAQQWIQMRDSNALEMSEAPSQFTNENPAPGIGSDEQGEADMEMEDDDQNELKHFPNRSAVAQSSISYPASDASTSPQNMSAATLAQPWYIQQQCSQPNVGIPSEQSSWNVWPGGVNGPRSSLAPNPMKSSISHIPSLLEITVPSHSEIKAMPDTPSESCTTLDAAKRKILPAWLREGLEKMERDKQKQLEKRRLQRLSITDNHEPVNEIMVNALKHKITAIVEEEEGEDECNSGNEDGVDDETISTLTRNSFSNVKNVEKTEPQTETATAVVTAKSAVEGKSYEQKLNDLMIVVRRTLTELLLEVTNNEISQIATETLKSHKFKASSAQVIRKSALATITGKLGLAAYADSCTDTETSDIDDAGNRLSDSDSNSDEELKNIIQTKKLSFKKVSEDIEGCVAAAAASEEEKRQRYHKIEEQHNLKERSIGSSESSAAKGIGNKEHEREFGETTTESKLHHSNAGKRYKERNSTRKERTTRFTDNKDNKAATLPPATCSYISQMPVTSNMQPKLIVPMSIPCSHVPTDPNGLIPNLLNSAGSILEEASKLNHLINDKSSKGRKKSSHRDERSKRSSSRSSSFKSSSSYSSADSPHSKYSNASSTKHHRSHRSKSSRDSKSTHNRHLSHSRSYSRRDHSSGRRRNRHHHHHSSDSDDKYNDRRHSSSSHSRSHRSSSRRDRSRSHSRSYSSKKHKHH